MSVKIRNAGKRDEVDEIEIVDGASVKVVGRRARIRFRRVDPFTRVERRTADPASPAVGRFWLRTDL